MDRNGALKLDFSGILLKWDKESNRRVMPWKGEKDPYRIWLSEIILQQTRVNQGLKYYQKFLRAFPTVGDLARANEKRVYKLWEGLGYYNRCKNLIHAARHISGELRGQFPGGFDELIKLKGIGHYTASAIASFAFGHPHAVLDGNVFRILSRLFGIRKPIDSPAGKFFFSGLANELLDKKQPGLYNQAIMDFGAVVCKPVPLCYQCPFVTDCKAFAQHRVHAFPVKKKNVVRKKRSLNYIIIESRHAIAIRRRAEKDIWHNLFEFFSIESSARPAEEKLLSRLKHQRWVSKNNLRVLSVSRIHRQQLTHQLIEGRFVHIKLTRRPALPRDMFWIHPSEIKKYPFPKFINEYLLESPLS